MASNTVARIEVKGAKELIRKFERMGINSSDVLEDAVRAGATLVERDADRMAPNPNIDQAVVVKTPETVQVDVGPDKEHWYYRFWEWGTKAKRPKRATAMQIWYGGQVVTFSRGEVPPLAAQPFLRPAYETNKSSAERAINQAIYTVVIRETRR